MDPSAGIEKFYYDLMMRSQYWSADEMQAYQRKQLTKLLNHARAYVPFYKNRLDAVFNHDGSINWNRWGDIPILKRQDLIDHREAMQATQLLAVHGPTTKFSSSGTTGVPVTTTHNALATCANRAAVIRAYNWHNIDWNKNVCEFPLEEKTRKAAWPDGKLIGTWGPSWDDYQKGQLWQIDRATPLKLTLQFFTRRNVAYLTMRPKAAQMLAHAAKQLNVKIKLDAVLALGTSVGEDDRHACLEAFGAKICALYSSKEGHKMAYQCPTGTHYHMMSEVSFLEILNDKNKPCKVGETGRVVVTPFFSYAQPLIRYEQGDLAEVGEPCSCGRTLPVINRIAGRVMHMFRFPNGAKIAPMLPDYCRTTLGSITWQMAQTAPSTIELRHYGEQQVTEESKQYITHLVKKAMYEDVEILFKKLDQMPLTPAGKFLEYVCELPVENSGA